MTDGVSVSLVPPWPWRLAAKQSGGSKRGTLWTLLVTLCIVIIRCTETFWTSCICQSDATPVEQNEAFFHFSKTYTNIVVCGIKQSKLSLRVTHRNRHIEWHTHLCGFHNYHFNFNQFWIFQPFILCSVIAQHDRLFTLRSYRNVQRRDSKR
jgi:hypothetical protein